MIAPIRGRMREFGTTAMLLTRLPVGRLSDDLVPFAHGAWAFPLVGALVGALAGAAFSLAIALGLTTPLAAIIAIATLVLLTGALHEDGLADAADGLGGRSSEQALAIMRDSRLGSYGAVALILSLAYRVAAVAALAPRGALAGLIVSAVAARVAMLGVPLLLPPARGDGLGAEFGRPPLVAGLAAVAIATLISLAFLPWGELAAVGAAVACALGLVAWSAARRFGGHTGDVFGAVEQIAECAALSVLVAWPGPPS